MTIELIRTYCLSKPGVTEDVKWGHNLCLSVGGKLFLIANPDEYPVSVSVKTSPELFEELTAIHGIEPAPYLARNHWIMITNIELLSKKNWLEWIDRSYELVFSRLSRKQKEQIL